MRNHCDQRSCFTYYATLVPPAVCSVSGFVRYGNIFTRCLSAQKSAKRVVTHGLRQSQIWYYLTLFSIGNFHPHTTFLEKTVTFKWFLQPLLQFLGIVKGLQTPLQFPEIHLQKLSIGCRIVHSFLLYRRQGLVTLASGSGRQNRLTGTDYKSWQILSQCGDISSEASQGK